jgi:hypothetical protein
VFPARQLVPPDGSTQSISAELIAMNFNRLNDNGPPGPDVTAIRFGLSG